MPMPCNADGASAGGMAKTRQNEMVLGPGAVGYNMNGAGMIIIGEIAKQVCQGGWWSCL